MRCPRPRAWPRRVLLAPLAAGLALVAAAWPHAAGATFPAANGRIAFLSARSGHSNIWSMNADGSGLRQLTTDSAGDQDPAWSPDGSKIAFDTTREPGGQAHIYTMNPDGSGQTRLAGADVNDTQPSWSPDGRRIVFVSQRDGSNPQLYVMNADGSGQTRFTNNSASDSHPSWSPDGTKIAFQSTRGGGSDIWVVNADGSAATQLTSTGLASAPDWSPDGSRIAFGSAGTGLEVMNADGSGQTVLAAGNAEQDPSWSPDGTRIAFQSFRDSDFEIYVMNADGSGQTRLTSSPGLDTTPSWGPPERRAATAPSPVFSKTAGAAPVSGTVLVELPGSSKFVRLSAATKLPVGSIVDATKGRVRITIAGPGGNTYTADFYEGVFKFTQPRRLKGIADMQLFGGNFKKLCKAGRSAAAAAASHKSVRHLWGSGAGKFRTSGRFSSASIRGTTWDTDDRCDGTLTKVTQGAVTVRDFVRRKTVVVKTGRQYLAQAP